MADHKADLIAWWKATMREVDACERLRELMQTPHSTADRPEAEDELRQSILARKELLWEQYQNMHQFVERIIKSAEGLLKHARPGQTQNALQTMHYSARSMQTILEMASAPEICKRAPG